MSHIINKEMKVVILGGGFAGARVAQELVKAGFKNVTLIDRKDYFEVTYACLRTLAQPDLGRRSRKRYTDFIQAEFLQGAVKELAEKSLTLEDNTEVAFDIGVVATGSSYPGFPIAKSQEALSLPDRSSEMESASQQLSDAQEILIIVGGIVGVELAGEIADHYPKKSVVIAHAGKRLVPELKQKASTLAFESLESLGVDILLSTRLTKENDQYKNADLIYWCIGLKPNTEIFNANFSDKLDEHGRVRVTSTLQVEGSDFIYALGDCANVPEGKLGYLADKQAAALAKNLIALSKGKSQKPYKPNPMMSLVPIGRDGGFVQLPFAVTSLKFMVNMKQKDMFIRKTFKTLG